MNPTKWLTKRAIGLVLLYTLCIPLMAQVISTQVDYGYVKIKSDTTKLPLYVDGGYVGYLPIFDSLKIPVGRHLFSFLDESMTSKLYPISERPETKQTDKTTVQYNIFGIPVTSSTATTIGTTASIYDKRLIEAGSQWVYVQVDGSVTVSMEYSKLASEQTKIAKEKKQLGNCIWGSLGMAVAIGGIVLLVMLETGNL